jgi:SAM-dependent methyltransferase
MKNQYAKISNEFQEARQMPVSDYLEVPSVIKATGSVIGKSVIDYACGDGFFARTWKRLGAEDVFGVDLSPEMIELARKKEENDPLGISYFVDDASVKKLIGSFDLATAIFLFNYADNTDTLFKMIDNVSANLKTGGRLVAVVPNPSFITDRRDTIPYGYLVEQTYSDPSKIKVRMTFIGEKTFSVEFTQWQKHIYEDMLPKVGLNNVKWTEYTVSDEGIRLLGKDFWQTTLDNPKSIILSAVKI